MRKLIPDATDLGFWCFFHSFIDTYKSRYEEPIAERRASRRGKEKRSQGGSGCIFSGFVSCLLILAIYG